MGTESETEVTAVALRKVRDSAHICVVIFLVYKGEAGSLPLK